MSERSNPRMPLVFRFDAADLGRSTAVGDSGLRWYLVLTKPARERIAQENLERQGYCVHYPQLLQPLRTRERWQQRVVGLFPRYMFLRLQVGAQSLGPVQSTTGVATIVRFGRDYAIVSDEVVEQLRARADPETGLHRLGSHTGPFAPGSRVRIAAGAFDGLEGVFQRATGGERVIVLLRILGQDTSVCVDAGVVLSGSTRRMSPRLPRRHQPESC
jgi:transcriptional antiterminator RfaH